MNNQVLRPLSDYVDPQPSTWALQHKFLSKLQEPHETVKNYSAELQKLSTDCDFSCENCGKSISNTLLRMQLIRGLKDSDVRARILQEKSIQSFQDVVKMATVMELAKDESSLARMDNKLTDSTVHKIGNKNFNNTNISPRPLRKSTSFPGKPNS